MEHPAYFVENQIAQINLAALSPTLSAKVIKRHVKDRLEIGTAWGLPQEILDIIAQHHGSTRISTSTAKPSRTPPTKRRSASRISATQAASHGARRQAS